MPMVDKRLVLLIEDDAAVLKVTSRIVESLGYEVEAADDIPGAVELVRARGGETVCALVDYSLKTGTGVDAIRRMRELDAEMPVIMLSGYPQMEIEAHVTDAPWTGFLQKPYSAGDLQATIERCKRT